MFIIWMCQKYCLYEEINEDYSIKLKNILNSLRYNELYFFIKEKELSDAEAMKFITFMRKNKESKWSKFFDKFNIFNINKVREDNSLHDKLEKKYLKFLNLNGQQSELKIDKGENNEIVEKTNN